MLVFRARVPGSADRHMVFGAAADGPYVSEEFVWRLHLRDIYGGASLSSRFIGSLCNLVNIYVVDVNSDLTSWACDIILSDGQMPVWDAIYHFYQF